MSVSQSKRRLLRQTMSRYQIYIKLQESANDVFATVYGKCKQGMLCDER